MELLNNKQVADSLNIGSATSKILMQGMRVPKLNSLFSETYSNSPTQFLNQVFEVMDINFEFDKSTLMNIPKKGPFITISNHPFGGVDGMFLLKHLLEIRPDFKIMGNYLLSTIEPISPHLIQVNPFDKSLTSKSSYHGLRNAIEHLDAGHPMGVFPAGEVSTLYKVKNGIEDKQWSPQISKLIMNSGVPVIPIYFHGSNSAIFHVLGKIHPMLRAAKLPSEFLNKKEKTFTVKIGKAIQKEEYSEFRNMNQLSNYLRSRTYALGSSLDIEKFFYSKFKKSRLSRKQEVRKRLNVELLKEDRENLINKGLLLFNKGNLEVFCAEARDIPFMIQEIGRLRELTFREIGEGTNRCIDIDEFDLYYQHLFIWDAEKEQLVGSYRLAKGEKVLRMYGLKGLYTNTLFKYDKRLVPKLKKSVEMGRSFVVKEYQKKPHSLFLLWKGILHFLADNPTYKYLIGPVSISNNYSKVSKELIVEYIKSYHFDNKLSEFVSARNKFQPTLRKIDTACLVKNMQNNMERLDSIIEDIEPDHFKVPVLLKKYIKQNAVILEFNRDPKFNNALDGLMFLDLNKLPQSTLESFTKGISTEITWNRFYKAKEELL